MQITLDNGYTITSLETVDVFHDVTGEYRFTLDELQNLKIANSEEKVDIRGKNGRKLSSLKRNKAVVVSGANGLVSGGLLEVQTGGTYEKKESTPIRWADYLTVTGNKAVLSYTAVGKADNEIDYAYVKDADGSTVEKIKQGTTAGDGIFAYDTATKTLSFKEGSYPDGTEIVVYYDRNVPGSVISNMSDTYSEKGEVFVNGFVEDVCGKTYRLQIHIPRADFSGTFDIDIGDNQTVHAFEAESIISGCRATKGLLWDYTVFTDEEVAA